MPPAHCTTNLNLQEGANYCTCARLGETNQNWAPPKLPLHTPTSPGEPGSYRPMRATYWEKAAMKLGRRSQSMPWISWPGIISTERRGRGWGVGWKKETDTNQSVWRHLDFTTPPTPAIHPLSPTRLDQPLSLSSLLLSICFPVFSVVCLPLGWKLCVYVLHYARARACV